MAGEGVNVGSIFGRLGYRYDPSGSQQFETARRKLETDTRKPIDQPLGFEVDEKALSDYHRELDRIRARTQKRDEFKAKLGADFDSRAFRAYEAELRKAEREAQQLERQQARLAAQNAVTRRSFHESSASAEALGGAFRSLYNQAGRITAVGVAIQGLSAAGAGLGALAAGLAPVGGALAAYPALASAAGQGLGVFKLATDNIFKAVGGLNERLDKSTKQFKQLTPEAKKVAEELDRLKKPIRELSTEAQAGLFPGLEAGIKDASKNLPVFRGIVRETAGALGDLARQAGALLGSKGFGRDLQTQGERNTVTLRRAGEVALNLADAMRHVVLAAGPLVDWMTRWAVRLSDVIDQQAQAGRKSGELAGFFHQTEVVISRLVRIAGDLGGALFNIGKQAYPLGSDLLKSITKNADKFREWTDSAKGRNAIAEFFRNARPAVYELGKLLIDVAKTFGRLGQGDQVAPILRIVRTQLLPALEQVVDSTTKSFGPAFIQTVTQGLKLFSRIAGSSGPLVQFTKLLGSILTGLNHLIDRVPALGTALSGVVALGGIAKALKLAAAFSGLDRLIGMLRTVRREAATTSAVMAVPPVAPAGAVAPAVAEAEAAGGIGLTSRLAGRAGLGGTRIGVGAASAAAGTRAALAGAGASAIGLLAGPVGALLAGAVASALVALASRSAQRRQTSTDTAVGRAGALPGLALSDPGQEHAVEHAFDIVRGKVKATDDQIRQAAKRLEQFFGRDLSDLGQKGVGQVYDALRKAAGQADTLTANLGRFKNSIKQIRAKDVLDPNAAAQLFNNFNRMREYGVTSIGDLRKNIAFNVKEITAAFQQGSPSWAREMTRNVGAGIDAVKRGMHDGAISAKDGTGEIARLVKQNLGLARNNMRSLSADGKAKLAQNFHDAADAVRDQMQRAGRVTKSGMQQVRGYLADELQVYGFSLHEARNITKGLNPTGGPSEGTRGPGHAGGGWIGAPGMVGTDTVPAMLAPGEAVLNRHQQAVIEGLLGGGFLDRLFANVRTPHYLAGGGYAGVSGDTDFVPALGRALSAMARATGQSIFVQSGRRSLAEQAAQVAAKGVWSPSNPHGAAPASPNAPHVRGIAADITPGRSVFGGVAGRFGLGFTVPTESWHIQLLSAAAAAAGAAGGAAKQIPRLLIQGGGAVGQVVQRALDMARGAGNRLLSSAAGSIVGTGENAPLAVGGGGGGANRALGRQMMLAFGFPAGQWPFLDKLWTRESGWDANARNRSSGAAGIPQDITGNMHGGARGQIAWGLNYIKGRYGTPAAAWAHELSAGWYGRGGRALRAVQRFAGGGRPNVATGSGHVTPQGFSLKAAQRQIRHRIGSYEQLMGDRGLVAKLRNEYSVLERRYNDLDGDLLDPQTGALNTKLLGEKEKLLAGMGIHAQQIRDALIQARKIAQRVVANYKALIRRLANSLKHAKKKDRSGIRSELADARSGRDEYEGAVFDLSTDDIPNARIDVSDLGKEYASLIGSTKPDTSTTDTGSSDSGSADTSGGGLTPDQQALLDQAAALKQVVISGNYIDTTAQRVLASFSPQTGFSTGAGAGGAQLVRGPDGSLRMTGAQGGSVAAGGNTIINNFNSLHPGDPKVWTALAKTTNAGNDLMLTRRAATTRVGL